MESSYDARQKQGTITHINFYDSELRNGKVFMIQNMQSVTYFLQIRGQMAVSSHQNSMEVSVQLYGKVNPSSLFLRGKI
jgi:hypothetical protein